MVAHPDIGQCLSFLLFGLALLLESQPVAMYHLTHTITSAFYMDNIYLDLEGTFRKKEQNRRHIPCRKKEQNRRHIPCRKKEQNRRHIPCRKKELSRYLPAIKGLCELFQPSGASGSYAQIFPTQTTYKQEICIHEKKLTMMQKRKLLQNRKTVPSPRH